MAGSYNHAVVREDPRRLEQLRDNEDFAGMIENIGDAYEMAEEMYGMIWLLAQGESEKVEWARQHWEAGIYLAPGNQRPQFGAS